jgi:hypothetical protein
MIKEEDYLKAKETVKKYEEQLRSANCYNELKAFLLEKKNGKRLCDWDDHKHQEIWDKMLELERKYS